MVKVSTRAVNFTLTPALTKQLAQKIKGTERFLRHFDTTAAELYLEVGLPSRHHRHGEIFYAEANLRLAGKLLRAEEQNFSLSVAINAIFKALEQQLKKLKERHSREDIAHRHV